jgi:phage terminase large subunit GpA-like protein
MRGLAYPVKGATTPQQKLVRKSNTKGRLYLVDQVAAKDQLYATLKIAKPGPGYQHFPSDTDPAYFEQLLAEIPVRNKRKYEKRDKDDPNEILDCHVYNDAALAIYAPRDLSALVEKAKARVEPPPQPAEPSEPTPDPTPAPAPTTRVIMPRHMPGFAGGGFGGYFSGGSGAW